MHVIDQAIKINEGKAQGFKLITLLRCLLNYKISAKLYYK